MALALEETATTDGRSKRRQKNAERIFDAAMRLFEDEAYDALSIDDICEAAGVGRATFFRIYRTKSGLLREFNRRMAIRIADRLTREMPQKTAEKLHILASEIAATWSEVAPSSYGLVRDFSETARATALHDIQPELLDLVEDIITEGLATEELKSPFPAAITSAMALTHLSAAAAFAMEKEPTKLKSLMSQSVDLWLNGHNQKKEAHT